MNLFLLPHQDDEYAVFPVLQHLAETGEPVEVIYLTSGTLSGEISNRRNRESIDVLARFGVSPEQIHFLGSELGLPDGSLYKHVEQASMASKSIFAKRPSPSRLFSPAWEGGHQDHDAAHVIACYLASAFDCLASSRQFPLYHGAGLPGPFWHTFSPLPENGAIESTTIAWRQRLRYLRYCLRYHSQWRTWLGLYPMYSLNLLLSGEQHLQMLSPHRLQQPPHAGKCLYERRGFCSWEQFAYHTRSLIDNISV